MVTLISELLDVRSSSATHCVLSHEWRNHFNKQLAAVNKVTSTVGELCAWINQPQPHGLPADINASLESV